MTENQKPLGTKAYGSIPHLPESNRGPADHGVTEQHARIFCHKLPSKDHRVILQVKLDGSCVSVYRDHNTLIPLIRAGYTAESSPHQQHRWFHRWVFENEQRFMNLLGPGERACGEWLAEAHGIRYELPHEPLAIFDIMRGTTRQIFDRVLERTSAQGFTVPALLSQGPVVSVSEALELLKTTHHGELDEPEGAVWRIELGDTVQDLAKYVRPGYIPGRYFPQISGQPTIYHWKPWTTKIL